MKKILCLLLCLLLMPCTYAVEGQTEAEAWLREKSLELASLVNDAIHSSAFSEAMMERNFLPFQAPDQMLSQLQQIDFSAPESISILPAPGIAPEEMLQAMQPMMVKGDISPALADWIISMMNSSIPPRLFPADDFDFPLLSSAFTVGSGYICPEFITESAWVTLEYDGDYMLLVSFDLIKDNGVISAGTTLLPADAMAELDAALAEIRTAIFGGERQEPSFIGEKSVTVLTLGEAPDIEWFQQILDLYGIEESEQPPEEEMSLEFEFFVDFDASNAYIPNSVPGVSEWIDETAMEMAALINEALQNDLYLSLQGLPRGMEDTLAAMRKIDFTFPNVTSQLHGEDLFAVEPGQWTKNALEAANTSDALYQNMLRSMEAELSESIYARYSDDMRALFNSLQMERAYVAPEGLGKDVDVLYFYEGNWALWIQFNVLDTGVVQVRAYPADKSAFESVINKFELDYFFAE